MNQLLHRVLLLSGICSISSSLALAAGFVTNPVPGPVGSPIVKVNCVPPGSPPGTNNCQVMTLDQPGYTQVANEVWPYDANVIVAGVTVSSTTVGTITKRLWRQGVTSNYILGWKFTSNSNTWNSTGKTFEINNMGWYPLGGTPVSPRQIAFFKSGPGDENLYSVSRSAYQHDYFSPPGVFVIHTPVTEVANDALNFKTDVNANDPDGTSRSSPWILLKCVGDAFTLTSTRGINGVYYETSEEGQTATSQAFTNFYCN